MTPCERLGYKIGDVFKALSDDPFSEGSLISLYKDDGSADPLFKLLKGSCYYDHAEGGPGAYINLERIEPINYSKEIQKENKKETNMYTFNVSAVEAIDFNEIHKELDRNNCICRVEFKNTESVRRIKDLKKQLQRKGLLDHEIQVINDEIKYITDVYSYYVVVHNSLISKANFLGIDPPDAIYDGVSYINQPNEYTKWVKWAREVKAASYEGPKGTVTVSKLEI